MAKTLVSSPILLQIWFKKCFLWVLLLLHFMHCYKLSLYAISRKTKELNLRKQQKTQFRNQFQSLQPKFGPPKIFFWILHLLDVANFAILRKTNKPNFGPNFGLFGPNSGQHFFFQKSGFVSHQISWSHIIMDNTKKNNDPILRKLGEGQTEGQTDRQTDGHTDKSDFMGHCLTSAECPKAMQRSTGLFLMFVMDIHCVFILKFCSWNLLQSNLENFNLQMQLLALFAIV